jgi:mono/diheme cytochrome c family protein
MRGFMPFARPGLLIASAILALALPGNAQKLPPFPNVGEDPSVTPVAGPSWLTHLGVSINRTYLGQGAGRYGPSPDRPPEPRTEALGVRRTIDLSGHDLYRLNCQACHGESGTGAPPEIKSVLGPVQGSSRALIQQHLQAEHDVTASADSKAASSQGRLAIVTRLHKGGARMPPRDYLQDQDVQVLFTYLTALAKTPDAQHPAVRTVSWARLGELTVKGTCHICHDAVGARPSGTAMLQGAIPPLESLLKNKSVADFVHKARSGDPVQMGNPGIFHRGRMPVFYYLKDEEIAAAYLYLATYPPKK